MNTKDLQPNPIIPVLRYLGIPIDDLFITEVTIKADCSSNEIRVILETVAQPLEIRDDDFVRQSQIRTITPDMIVPNELPGGPR